jgi:hypothetical protein
MNDIFFTFNTDESLFALAFGLNVTLARQLLVKGCVTTLMKFANVGL